MPELPEVETVRRELDPWLSGRIVLRAERIDAPPGPKYAHLELAAGRRIRRVERRGKFLLAPLVAPDRPLDEPATPGEPLLVIHLGMTGVVRAEAPAAHERVRLTLDTGPRPLLHFQDVRRFGRFLVLADGDPTPLPTLAALGPEPLGDAFAFAAFARSLAASRAPVKALLLSQRAVAGVGNIYADEALFRAGIHPATPAFRVPRARAKALHGAIREVLAEAIQAQGTTLNDYRTVSGSLGAYRERLAVYGHEHDPCPRCGTQIERTVVAARGTHHCPRCQPVR